MFTLFQTGYSFIQEAILGSNKWIMTNIIDKIVNYINPFNLGVWVLYQYSSITMHLQKYYQEYWAIKAAVNSVNYAGKYIYAKWTNIRVEPSSVQWNNVCILSCDPNELNVTVLENDQQRIHFGCYFSETYYSNNDWPKERAQESYVMECAIQAAFSESGDIETLMLMKSGELYLSRIVCCLQNQKDYQPISWEPSFARFLSVEYSHPEMTGTIVIEMDKGYWLEGNQLLSAAFVKRCLEYQNKPYYFDMNYTLKIMDDNINIFEMGSDSYVMVGRDDYKILKM
jgi:hypothetical protein